MAALPPAAPISSGCSGIVPFYYFHDVWAVRADGLIARVTSDTFEVVWLRDGKETGRTGAIPYQAIAITAAEQQAVRDSIAEQYKATTASVNTAGAGAPGAGGGRGGAPMAAGMAGGQTFVDLGAGGTASRRS